MVLQLYIIKDSGNSELVCLYTNICIYIIYIIIYDIIYNNITTYYILKYYILYVYILYYTNIVCIYTNIEYIF